MNNIYELANTVFQAETLSAQKNQYQVLKDYIQKKLLKQEDNDINEAIYALNNEQKPAVSRLIEDVTQELISTHLSRQENVKLRTDFFIIPIITNSEEKSTKLCSLSNFESAIESSFLRNELIAPNSKVILSPILLGHQTSAKMTISKWYDLHQQTLKFSSSRHLRPLFSKEFTFNTQPKFPTLNFIVGLIQQDISEENAPKPFFLRNNVDNQNQKNNFQNELQNLLQEKNPQTEILVLQPEAILNGLLSGYVDHQELLINLFVNKYSEEENVDFALLSIESINDFIMIAWNKQNNTVENYLLIESLNSTLQDNIDKTMEYLAPTGKIIYIGNSTVQSQDLANYTQFNFKNYLNTEGATIIQNENNEPEFIED